MNRSCSFNINLLLSSKLLSVMQKRKGDNMPSVQIGYRRLYDSMGCSIANQQTINLVFPIRDHLQAEIYMGNKPKFGITVETGHEDYLIPGTQTTFGHYSYQADATQSSYPRSFFTEIICFQVEEISDELFEAFYHDDMAAAQELLRIAETHKEEYHIVADFLGGVIGLRHHPDNCVKTSLSKEGHFR